MKTSLLAVLLFALDLAAAQAEQKEIPNRLIDYPAFLEDAKTVEKLRSERRVTEEEFLRMSAEPGTVVLDARSAWKYAQLHIKGARNLSLPDVTAAELARILPDKNTRILIYCNNNFKNEPLAMPTKAFSASLNIYTFNTLYAYGYKNVYELGPVIPDINASKLPFEGSQFPKDRD
jgi:phage shock protein E